VPICADFCEATGVPHSGQNLASSEIFAPHPLHINDVETPHDGQNLETLSAKSKKQLEHFIVFSKNICNETLKVQK
jgi:hypothetical protein